jgi:Dolichyl-phosphate-mannose-protein mannosyltransferase
MSLILPFIALAFLYSICKVFYSEWRISILSATVIWGLVILIVTEILSFVNFIQFEFIFIAWLFIDIVLASVYFKLLKKTLADVKPNLNFKIPKALYAVAFILVLIGIIGFVSPPNNWDSMDYHMSRVTHWMQNHNVGHYPASYTPQLYQNPWSEFVIMHFQILSGGDYFANSMQWLSMIGCLIGVSLIAKLLDANLVGQLLATVTAATIPMGILQASSTQNDFAEAFWLVCFACYVLITVQRGKNSSWNIYLLLGCSLGLSILTKGSAYFYILPFLVWVVISQVKHLGVKVWKPASLVAIVTLLINLNHYLRNYYIFSSPLGEPSDYQNGIFGINVMISNILRNLALHIGTPLGLWNGISNRIIQIIHNFLGIGFNDKRTTFYGEFFVPGGWSTFGFSGEENNAGNLLHLLLFLTCILIFIFQKKLKLNFPRDAFLYLLTVCITFCIFCYLVKWQPWNARLHLPFFILTTPFIGLLLSNIAKKQVVNFIAIILIISALPWVFFNRYRPIIDSNNIFQATRIEQYFKNRPKLQEPYTQAVEYLTSKQCNQVGLVMGQDAWEYPLWILMQQSYGSNFKLQHINVTNVSSTLENKSSFKSFLPCGVIHMHTKRSKQEKVGKINFRGNTFVREWELNQVTVLIK